MLTIAIITTYERPSHNLDLQRNYPIAKSRNDRMLKQGVMNYFMCISGDKTF